MADSHRATFVDLDETIYPGSTIKDTGRFLLRRGALPRRTYLKILWWLVLRKAGLLNDEAAFAEGVGLLAGRGEADLGRLIRQAYARDLRPRVPAGVWQLARAWRRRGPLVLATESLRPIAAPFAEELGASAVLATDLEVKNGILTGRLRGPVRRGAAKNQAVAQWARRHGVALPAAAAVGARLEDGPLLSLVGHGLMLNPDRPAARLARARGWEIVTTPE